MVDEKLRVAKELCEKKRTLFSQVDFRAVYPFTTENIAGYINEFDLKNKSLLTVGSSADQVINAAFKGCKDITVLDKSIFAKEYFYLKKAAILNLDQEELFRLLCYYGYPKKRRFNKDVLDPELLERILPTLREEDEESYRFWTKLLSKKSRSTIRERVFIIDENYYKLLKKKNPYLSTDENYQKTRKRIKDLHPKFIISDVRDVNIRRNYDNIFLSNILDYIVGIEGRNLIAKVIPHLNDNGKVLLYYLFETSVNGENPEIEELYDPSDVLYCVPIFSEIKHFTGVKGMIKNNCVKDGVVIYQKKKH